MLLVGKCRVAGDRGSILGGVGGEFGFGFGDIDTFYEVERKAFDFLKVIVIVEKGGKFVFAPVEAEMESLVKSGRESIIPSHTAATFRLMSTSRSTLISPKVCFRNRALRSVLPHPATGQGAGP